jgi:hypothetical protein
MPAALTRAFGSFWRARLPGGECRPRANPAPDGQLVRAIPREGGAVDLTVDGVAVEAVAGESVLAAVLRHGRVLRRLEFDGAPRAGFCLMGACQDCWIWVGDDRRVRACTTPVASGMEVSTAPPGKKPPLG